LTPFNTDNTLLIYKTKNVKTPERTGKNAGFDFFVPEDNDELTLEPLEGAKIPSGIKCKLPEGYALIAFNKSGMAVKYNLQVGACVVDENYTGEIHLNVFNLSNNHFTIKPGMKLLQFVLIKPNYAHVVENYDIEKMYNEDDYKERGEKGLGSTGI
jgi:dUTP pyrophosphatase